VQSTCEHIMCSLSEQALHHNNPHMDVLLLNLMILDRSQSIARASAFPDTSRSIYSHLRHRALVTTHSFGSQQIHL
jgi:hypothetical protein